MEILKQDTQSIKLGKEQAKEARRLLQSILNSWDGLKLQRKLTYQDVLTLADKKTSTQKFVMEAIGKETVVPEGISRTKWVDMLELPQHAAGFMSKVGTVCYELDTNYLPQPWQDWFQLKEGKIQFVEGIERAIEDEYTVYGTKVQAEAKKDVEDLLEAIQSFREKWNVDPIGTGRPVGEFSLPDNSLFTRNVYDPKKGYFNLDYIQVERFINSVR